MTAIRLALPLLAALLLACCAQTGTGPAGPALAPPAALSMTGVPPVPASLPARVGRYTEFKGAGLLDWSPDGRRLLVAWRQGDRVQLHTVTGAGAALQQVTRAAEPTTQGAFLQADGKPMPFPQAQIGGRSVGTPGVLRALEMAHKQHGRLPWATLFEPAIKLAEHRGRVAGWEQLVAELEKRVRMRPMPAVSPSTTP